MAKRAQSGWALGVYLGFFLCGMVWSGGCEAVASQLERLQPLKVSDLKFEKFCYYLSRTVQLEPMSGEDRLAHLLKKENLTASQLISPLKKLKLSTVENNSGDLEPYSIDSLEILDYTCNPQEGLEAFVRVKGHRDGFPVTSEYIIMIENKKDKSSIEDLTIYPGGLAVGNPQLLQAIDLLGLGGNVVFIGLMPYISEITQGVVFQLIIPTGNSSSGEFNNNFEGQQLGMSYMNAIESHAAHYTPNPIQPISRIVSLKETVLTFIRPFPKNKSLTDPASGKVSVAPQLIVERVSSVAISYTFPDTDGKKNQKHWQHEAFHSWHLDENPAADPFQGF